MSNEVDENAPRLQAKARRLAAKEGYIVRRTRRYAPPDLYGGFAVFDARTNFPVVGWKYDLTAKEVIAWLSQ